MTAKSLSLIGKSVKTDKLEFLSCFYPAFVIRKSVSRLDQNRRVLYTGPDRADLHAYLHSNTKQFINVCPEAQAEVTLQTPEQWVKFVYTRHRKAVPEDVKAVIPFMRWSEIEYCIKLTWVTGGWPYQPKADSISVDTFYKALSTSGRDAVNAYFRMEDVYPVPVIESFVLKFLRDARRLDEKRVPRRMYIRRATLEYHNLPSTWLPRMRLLYLICELWGGPEECFMRARKRQTDLSGGLASYDRLLQELL